MSSFDSMARFESTLDHATVDVGPRSESFEQVYQQSSIPEPAIALPQKKAAKPAPSYFSPWLLSLAYPLGRFIVLPFYFGQIEITGREYLPLTGPVILAPTHRSRWDSIMVPYAAGHHVTGRHLRYMVSADEVTGLQGWLIRRMGGFPINTNRPAISSLRHGVDLLEAGESLVIFPEGNIFRESHVQPLKPGLARLAIQAEISRSNLGIKIVPISVHYQKPLVPWRCDVEIAIGPALQVSEFCTGCSKQDAKVLTAALQTALERLV